MTNIHIPLYKIYLTEHGVQNNQVFMKMIIL